MKPRNKPVHDPSLPPVVQINTTRILATKVKLITLKGSCGACQAECAVTLRVSGVPGRPCATVLKDSCANCDVAMKYFHYSESW